MPSDLGPNLRDDWRHLRCRLRDDVAVTDLGDQLVLLDPRNQEMFALDAVGRFIWQALPDSTLAAIADALAERYRIDPATARNDLTDLVRQLEGAGLLRVEGAGTPDP